MWRIPQMWIRASPGFFGIVASSCPRRGGAHFLAPGLPLLWTAPVLAIFVASFLLERKALSSRLQAAIPAGLMPSLMPSPTPHACIRAWSPGLDPNSPHCLAAPKRTHPAAALPAPFGSWSQNSSVSRIMSVEGWSSRWLSNPAATHDCFRRRTTNKTSAEFEPPLCLPIRRRGCVRPRAVAPLPSLGELPMGV